MRGRIGRDTCSRLNRERDVAEFVIQYVPLMTIQALLLFGVVPLARRVIPTDRTHDTEAHCRVVMEASLLGAARRLFQAVQQASTMASYVW